MAQPSNVNEQHSSSDLSQTVPPVDATLKANSSQPPGQSSQGSTEITKSIVSPAPVTSSFHWAKGAPNCLTTYVDGVAYHTICGDGIALSCSLIDSGKWLVAKAVVDNHTNHAIDVLPENFSIRDAKPVDGKYLGKGAGAANILAAISRKPVYGMSTSDDSNGTVYKYRYGLLGFAASQAANRASKQSKAERALADHLLKANTLMPGQIIVGDLIFAKDKPIGEVWELSVKMGPDTFLF